MEIEIQRDPGADAIARYLGIDLRELAERDRFQQPLARWLAYDGHHFVGLATAFVRADDRLFVTHRLQDEAAFGPLLHAAVEDTAAQDTAVQDTAVQETTSPINLSIGLDQNERLRIARQAGFVTDLSARAYDVPFRPALKRIAAFRTAALPPPALQSNTVEIVQADEVSLDELFALDTELRQDVPGNDGWRGNRVWFDDEMTSPEYDPTAYVVGRDRRSGDLVGLCRIWNNSDGPALGMLGVRRSHRTGWPALRLLHASMLAASRWGSPSFSTNTARPSLQRRLRTIGAVETGGFLRLIQAGRPAGYGC